MIDKTAQNYDLHPAFPIVEGHAEVVSGWWVELKEPHNRRFVGDATVLWRSGVTLWLTPREQSWDVSLDDQMLALQRAMPEAAFNMRTESNGNRAALTYQLNEIHDGDVGLLGVYGAAFTASRVVEVAIYFDEEGECAEAAQFIRALRHLPPGLTPGVF